MEHSPISSCERFTEFCSLIQVEVSLIIFQGWNHQQGMRLDMRQTQLTGLQLGWEIQKIT